MCTRVASEVASTLKDKGKGRKEATELINARRLVLSTYSSPYSV